VDQTGRYIVLEVGDQGKVGVWRREGSRWYDLVPWTPAAAVVPGSAPNELTVRAVDRQLTLLVNGTQVAQVETALRGGGVGVFVGGDLNEVALEHFRLQVVAEQSTVPAASGTSAALSATLPQEITELRRRLDLAWASASWPEALALIDRLEKAAPAADLRDKRYAAHMAMGQDLLAKGNRDAALREFATAASIDPDRGEANAALRALTAPVAPAPEPAATAVAPPVQADPAWLERALQLVRAYDRQHGTVLYTALQRTRIVVLPTRGAWAAFVPRLRTITLHPVLQTETPEAVASVLAHEAQHAVDMYLNGLSPTEVACYTYEISAFHLEAAVWQSLEGPAGKPNPSTALEKELNQILMYARTDATRLLSDIQAQYEDQCSN
jgi:tetratricopeptide (TPR) repeat protein